MRSLLVINAIALSLALPLRAVEEKLPSELEGVGIEEKLGQKIDLDLQFTAHNGYQVPLRSFFSSGKPVLLNLVYYRCPMLCNLVLNAQADALRQVAWTPGEQFEVVTISIDPAESWDLARQKRMAYLTNLEKDGASWNFLVDHQGNAAKLADQVGFRYRWDPRLSQFAHAAAIMFLTPDGRVSRYLYGAQYKPRDVRLALTEASEGKLGTTVDKLLMFCFHYDAEARSYVPFARNLMRAGGTLTVFILALFLLRLWRSEILNGARRVVTAK